MRDSHWLLLLDRLPGKHDMLGCCAHEWPLRIRAKAIFAVANHLLQVTLVEQAYQETQGNCACQDDCSKYASSHISGLCTLSTSVDCKGTILQ